MSNEPRFEVFPEKYAPDHAKAGFVKAGSFVWHFQDANGKITFVGGESFTRREDAHRSIRGVVGTVASLLMIVNLTVLDKTHLPIIDLDENGKAIA